MLYGWPYSMYDADREGEGTFKNWFALVVAETYSFQEHAGKRYTDFLF